MGTVVRFPLRHRVKIREDLYRSISRLGVRERVEILRDIKTLRRMGLISLTSAMSMSLKIGTGKDIVTYGILVTDKRAFLLKCRKNSLFVCAVIDVESESRSFRVTSEVLVKETIPSDTGSCQIIALLTPAHTILLFGRVQAAGAADELVGKELRLVA
jgi:hypothetical protein